MTRKKLKPYFQEAIEHLKDAEEKFSRGENNASVESIKLAKSYMQTTATHIQNEIKYKERGYRNKSELNKFNEGQLVEFIRTEEGRGKIKKYRYHKGDVGTVIGYNNKHVRVRFPGHKYAVVVPENHVKVYSGGE